MRIFACVYAMAVLYELFPGVANDPSVFIPTVIAATAAVFQDAKELFKD